MQTMIAIQTLLLTSNVAFQEAQKQRLTAAGSSSKETGIIYSSSRFVKAPFSLDAKDGQALLIAVRANHPKLRL